MIFTNFVFFILAIAIFSTAPVTPRGWIPPVFCFYALVVIILFAWNQARYQFIKLRDLLKQESISIYEAKKRFQRTIDIHVFISLVFFVIEIYVLDLKSLLLMMRGLGTISTFVNVGGLAIFVIHLAVVWYWAFKSMGNILQLGQSTESYIWSNLKFNLVIVIPWIAMLVIHDVINLINPIWLEQIDSSVVYQTGFFALFLVLIAIFSPVLVTRLWDCKPLANSELRDSIAAFCKSRGVRFRNIMAWNALNGSLVTAGVMGLIPRFRYLLITPELMKMFTTEEIIGVVSHEVGHVKRRHLIYYLVFFLGFMILGAGLMDWILVFGISILPEYLLENGVFNYLSIFFALVMMLIYLRFIFGYFMRNFERQADIYCFEAGVDPNYLVTSFMKLGAHFDEDKRKKNWHHFSLAQRIDFLRECIDNPNKIAAHHRIVKRAVSLFLILLFSVSLVSFFMPAQLNYHFLVKALKNRIEKEPENPKLYSMLGMVTYQLEEWQEAKVAYEKSLKYDYYQSEVLNNLAWLYLKCPDENYINPHRALELAKDAARLDQSSHILDTLAEAYYQNGMYKEALIFSQKALQTSKENHSYFKKQWEKMLHNYKTFHNLSNI